MGDATAAVAEGVRTVVRNPVVVGVTAAVLVALAPVAAVAGLLGVALSVLLVGPFVLRAAGALVAKPLLFGGVAGVAAAGVDGDASPGDYTDALRGSFGSLAGAYLAHEALVLVVTVAAGVGALLVVVAGSALPGPTERPAELAAVGVGGAGGLVLLALAVALQFVDVATVVGGADARGALRESLWLTRRDPIGVVGYTALRVALFGAILLPGAVVALLAARVRPELSYLGLVVVGLLLPVAFAAATAAHVAYYRRRTGSRPPP